MLVDLLMRDFHTMHVRIVCCLGTLPAIPQGPQQQGANLLPICCQWSRIPIPLHPCTICHVPLLQLDDNYGKAGNVEWGSGIPPLPEVTMENLKYDIADAQRFKKWQVGCPKPKELEQ